MRSISSQTGPGRNLKCEPQGAHHLCQGRHLPFCPRNITGPGRLCSQQPYRKGDRVVIVFLSVDWRTGGPSARQRVISNIASVGPCGQYHPIPSSTPGTGPAPACTPQSFPPMSPGSFSGQSNAPQFPPTSKVSQQQ